MASNGIRKTAVASEYYFGHDTFGRRVELARREGDGKFFARFGNGPFTSKWAPHNGPVVHPTTGRNRYTGETFTYDSETSAKLVEWGFQLLRAGETKGLRLPKG